MALFLIFCLASWVAAVFVARNIAANKGREASEGVLLAVLLGWIGVIIEACLTPGPNARCGRVAPQGFPGLPATDEDDWYPQKWTGSSPPPPNHYANQLQAAAPPSPDAPFNAMGPPQPPASPPTQPQPTWANNYNPNDMH